MYERSGLLSDGSVIAAVRPCDGRLDRSLIQDSRAATEGQSELMRPYNLRQLEAIMGAAYLSARRRSAFL